MKVEIYNLIPELHESRDTIREIITEFRELGIATITEVPGKAASMYYRIYTDSFIISRKQCSFERIAGLIGNQEHVTIALIEADLFAEGLNWCFGGWSPSDNCLIVSIARIRSKEHLKDLFAHEFGHMLGACTEGRSNTTEMLGTHCTNPLCVMQQKMTISESISYCIQRQIRNATYFCPQCLEEIKSNN